jgi:hypothetical protein
VNSEKVLKTILEFKSDAEAERFVEEADLTEYDLSGFRAVRMNVVKTPAQHAVQPRLRKLRARPSRKG